MNFLMNVTIIKIQKTYSILKPLILVLTNKFGYQFVSVTEATVTGNKG